MKQSTTRWFIPIPAIFLAFYSLSAKADNGGVCLPPVIATLPPVIATLPPETVAPPPETIAIPIATMPVMLIPPTTSEPVRLVGPVPLVPPSVETTMLPPPETLPPPTTTIVNQTSTTTSIFVSPTTTVVPVPISTSTTIPANPELAERLEENAIVVNQAIEILNDPEAVFKMDAEEIAEVFDKIDVEIINPQQAAKIIDALVDAPLQVITIFEKKINIFEGSFDTYVPAGSNIPVRTRRSVAAAGVLIATAGTVTKRSK